jgi:thiol-disulfide isomerase/thioredoxin
MKRLLYSILAIIACISSINGQNISIVNGIWERGTPENVKLFAIENSTLRELASSALGANGEFLFAFSPQEEGFFAIGFPEGGMRRNRSRYIFYFKPGDQLNVTITADGFELTGNNTPENIEMAKWHAFIHPVDLIAFGSGTYVEFFPLLEAKAAELKNYPQADTPNSKFNTDFAEFRKIDFLSQALRFVLTPRAAHPQNKNDYPDFYRNIDLEDLTKDEFILRYPDGLNLLRQAQMAEVLANESKSMDNVVFIVDDPRIKSPVIKGELVAMFAGGNRSLAGFHEYRERYGQYIVTDSQRERMRAVELALFNNSEGNNAIDFTFPNVDGNMVSLSDFKGKAVYIDVWATWCAPCKREIPHLLTLKEEYKDNENIVFMCVSVDASSDKQKWKDFLVAEGMSGVQLFAGDDAQRHLMEPYNIMGIPRFILVGKDGKVIFADAPRPSSSEIRAILNDALRR